jgi:hypothetical protein
MDDVLVQVMWAEQEEWMSSYRQPNSRRGSRSSSPGTNSAQDAHDSQTRAAAGADHGKQDVSTSQLQAPELQEEQKGGSKSSSSSSSTAARQQTVEESSAAAQPKQCRQAAADEAAARGMKAAEQSAAAAAAAAAATAVGSSNADAQAEAAATAKPARRSSSKSRSRAAAAAAALSPAEEALVTQRFVPTMSDEFPDFAAVTDAIVAGDLAAETTARMLGLMPLQSFDKEYAATAAGYASDEGPDPYSAFARQQNRSRLQRQHSASSGGGTDETVSSSLGGSGGGDAAVATASTAVTTSGSSSSSKGYAGRKSIAAVKLEQDLEIKACEEAAVMNNRRVCAEADVTTSVHTASHTVSHCSLPACCNPWSVLRCCFNCSPLGCGCRLAGLLPTLCHAQPVSCVTTR